jgi:hypothetical protein
VVMASAIVWRQRETAARPRARWGLPRGCSLAGRRSSAGTSSSARDNAGRYSAAGRGRLPPLASQRRASVRAFSRR